MNFETNSFDHGVRRMHLSGGGQGNLFLYLDEMELGGERVRVEGSQGMHLWVSELLLLSRFFC